jgi:hypothetical protein
MFLKRVGRLGDICLEALAATEFFGIFSGIQPSQDVKVAPNHQHTLKLGTELDPETSEYLNNLTRLSARENSAEF